MKRGAQSTTPIKRGSLGYCLSGNELLQPPVAKKQRWHPLEESQSQDMMNERLVHLNKVAIECLQNGECDKAQCFLLNALDLIKARQLGFLFEQTPPLACWRSMENSTSSPGCDRLDASNGLLVGQDTKPQARDMSLRLAKGNNEGIRASTEPLQLSTYGYPPSQQAAIIYYNVGISFLCFHQPKGARQWFNLALICFEDGGGGTDPSVMARLHYNIGFCLTEEYPDRAVKAYRLALLLASRSPDLSTDGTFLASNINAIGVMLFRMGQYESALIYLKDSLGHYAALNGKHQEIASVTHNMGRVHFALQEFNIALSEFEQGLALRRRNKDTSVVDLAASLCSIGSTLEKLGREDEAVEFYTELLDQDCLDINPVDFTLVCSALANIYKGQGNVKGARELYEKAVRTGRSCLGETHPVVAGSLMELAECHLKSGDATQAIENYNAALELEHLASEKTHVKTVKVLYSLALLYQRFGQYAAALEKFGMAYELQKKKFGASSKAAQKPRANMADMEYRLKNFDKAFEIYQEILNLKQASGDDDESGCSFLLNSLGIVSFAKGDLVLASKFFQSCLEARSTWSCDSATVLYNLATAEEKLGHHEKAIECFEKSLAMDETTTPLCENSSIVLDTLQRLGRMYQISGDLHRALECAIKALERLGDTRDAGSLLVKAKLHNLTGNLHLQLGNVGNMMQSYTKAIELFRAAGHGNDEALIIAGFYLYGFSKLHPSCAGMA